MKESYMTGDHNGNDIREEDQDVFSKSMDHTKKKIKEDQSLSPL